MDADDFRALLARARAGDQEATTQLLRECEPNIRRELRIRLTDPYSASDVVQSVYRRFLCRDRLEPYDLSAPAQLGALLRMITRTLVHRLRGQGRGGRPAEGGDALDGIADRRPGPDQIAAAKDLLEAALRRLPPRLRELARLRAQGLSWPEVARQAGGHPEVLRQKFTQALDLVLEQLGTDVLS
jgi:RNA polymerase sigma factor (sigma-70 family)